LYFSAIGQKSAYKCIVKGLMFEHIVEYLAMNLVKIRICEIVYLTC